MNEINTVMEPFTWNYTQPKGNNFSRLIEFNADMTGAQYFFEIKGAKGIVRPQITVVSITPTKTTINVYLSGHQTAAMSNQNEWFFKVILGPIQLIKKPYVHF